jgi:hypothetical protein
MKPVLIYGMPRTRSTAAMQACKRAVKLNEPFAFHHTPHFDPNNMASLSRVRTLVDYEQSEEWNLLLKEMNLPDTVVKIFGRDLVNYYDARAWFNEAHTTHEIFTLMRDPRETILSILLAQRFGHWVGVEKEIKEIIIDDREFDNVDSIFSSFLRFYPKSSRLVTFENLPEEFFDRSQITLKEQHSMSRLHLIKNLNRVEKNIDSILRYFAKEWKDVTGLDIHAPLPY